MKKLVFCLLLLTQFVYSQQVDTVVTNSVFTSYYSFVTNNPVIVTYTLNYINGDCDRSKYDFRDTSKIFCDESFVGSGFDRGHLCNAEDVSTDCEKVKLTFSYFNCSPQVPFCNRSSWKRLENQVRFLATEKNVLVIKGVFTEESKKLNCMTVPSGYYKIVVDQTTNKIILCSAVWNNTYSPPYMTSILGIMTKVDKQHKILLNAILSNVIR